ncbi:hypothetical protein I6F35_33705 [Bradyrhizobium sp. BRP22]|uniref:hypothetical protein n=1 Tax=Bradyrhizobium sp. BRP22 TaxID=2793821 RepID=UPI001CD45E10|nr:hypothetical protein [Bradyrhizobium sp. BRP22]MCA1458092.1 hypothetical protein [Bradyrhizobium sp. BRP22]
MKTEADKTNQNKPEDNIEVHNAQIEDSSGQDHSLQAPPAGDQPREKLPEPPKVEPIGDGGRSAIAEKFKRLRADKEPPVETTGDFIHPSQTYGQVGADQQQPAGPAVPAEVAPPEPPKRKLKVNGQEREYSDEEVIALAQKAAAADDYLEQAKQKFNDARQVLETTRVHVSRQNPADQPAPTATDGDDPDEPQNPASPLKEVIKQIQYGDPDEAEQLLGKTIAEAATAAVRQVSMSDRVQEDIASDLRAHDDFVKKNPELASDPIAHSVIRDGLLTGYRDDLRKIGVPEEDIPTDPSRLANEHRHHKLQGKPVRTVETLLNDAADRLTQWRGGTPRRETPTPPPSTEPRVEVNLQRDDRRRAIPQQPQRANVQSSAPAQQPQDQMSSRRAAVARAQQARGQA